MITNNPSEISPGDLMRWLVYTHNRANANTAALHETSATVQALLALLVERGMAVAMQEFAQSKYAFAHSAEVVCADRLLFCKAACCRLPLALSKEDVQEGVVRWDLGQPYMLAHNGDGYCVHMDRSACTCTIYQQRPIPCRGYDCHQDRRI